MLQGQCACICLACGGVGDITGKKMSRPHSQVGNTLTFPQGVGNDSDKACKIDLNIIPITLSTTHTQDHEAVSAKYT